MVYIDENAMKSLLTMKDAVEIIKRAMAIYTSGRCFAPLRTRIEMPKGVTLLMPAYAKDVDMTGLKVVSVFPDNAKLGKPTVPATMFLISGDTGEVVCAMDGTFLTKIRTGAVQAAATDILSRKESRTAMVIGCGNQAPYQIEGLLTVRNIEKLYLSDVFVEKAENLREWVEENFEGVSACVVKDPREVMEECDIIVAVTTSEKPVIHGKLLKEGAYVCSMGSFTPKMQEIDEAAIERAGRVFVDTAEGCVNEAGDVIKPLKKGIIRREDVIELGRVILGEKFEMKRDTIRVFKSVGLAIFDLMTAYEIYRKWEERSN